MDECMAKCSEKIIKRDDKLRKYHKKYLKLIEQGVLKNDKLMDEKDLKWLIRYMLGQRKFSKDMSKPKDHLRLLFHCEDEEDRRWNQQLIEIFRDIIHDYKPMIQSRKGIIYYTIDDEKYEVDAINKYIKDGPNDPFFSCNNDCKWIDVTGYGTIEIIYQMIKDIYHDLKTNYNDSCIELDLTRRGAKVKKCKCGNVIFNENYDQCWDCKKKVLDKCKCGKYKKKIFETCYTCKK
jgi:hypothetical protein